MLVKFPIALLAVSSGAMAYKNKYVTHAFVTTSSNYNLSPLPSPSIAGTNLLSCQGSTNSPEVAECYVGIGNIDASATYSYNQEFSHKSCYIKYATNDGNVAHPVSGQKIKDVASSIVANCGHHKGSYGTENCDGCHVTVNYRKSI